MKRLAAALLTCLTGSLSAQDGPAPVPADHVGMSHADMVAPKTPQLLRGYGSGGFRITTSVPKAQAFFDNGMQLAHAFAHKAAIAAMAEAVRLDPTCAMCLWGQAWASGPTINYGKSADEIAPLTAIADKAADLAETSGTDRERALIHALQMRYRDGGGGTGKLTDDDGSRQAQQLTLIARNVLAGRAAMLDRRPGDAAIAFAQAAELQEGESFSMLTDPPGWYYPVRRDLAEALLASGDRAGARREAEAALRYRAKDPGALALLRKL